MGGGYVQFSEELPFKAGEGKAKFDLLEDGGIDEEKWSTVVSFVVGAYGLSRETRVNSDFVVMFFAE